MEFFDTTFWQNFVSNLFATLIGAFVGILAALWVDRWRAFTTEREKTAKIFDLLVGELESNYTLLVEWQDSGKDPWKLTTIGVKMSDEVWNAFSDGGELEWIKDPLILSFLASAYADVKRIKYLSDKYLPFNTMPASTVKYILADLESAIKNAQLSIVGAVAFVKAYRKVKKEWEEHGTLDYHPTETPGDTKPTKSPSQTSDS